MKQSLNDAQLEILKLFNRQQSEEDLQELKSLLTAYLADKVVRDADEAFEKHNYSEDVFNNWKAEHFRKSRFV